MTITSLNSMNHRWRRFALCIVICLLGAVAIVPALTKRHVSAVGDVPASLIAPVLAGDWKQAAHATPGRCCGAGTTPTAIKMLRSHALLATNHNTDAACILLNATDRVLKAWADWTSELVTMYPAAPASHFLHADALARLQLYPDAITEYGAAIEASPHDALALNGRGQVYAALADWPHAIADFEDAAAANPRLADAFANRGWVFIQKRSGERGAIEWFTKALQIAPDFAMARHGLGCAELVLGDIKQGMSDFKAPTGTCAARLAAGNAVGIAAYLRGMSRSDLLVSLRSPRPGTTLDKKFTDPRTMVDNWKSNPTQVNFNKIVNGINSLPQADQKAFLQKFVNPILLANQDLHDKFKSQSYVMKQWNDGLGGQLGGIVKSFLSGVGTGLGFAPNPLTKLAGVGIAGSGKIAEYSLNQWSGKNQKTFDIIQITIHDIWQQPKSSSFSIPPGGVDVTFAQARCDDGDWPFSAVFGLQYQPAKPNDSERTNR